MIGGAPGLGGFHGFAEQFPAGDGGEGAGQMELGGVVGIGAGTLGNDQVIEVNILLNGTGRAYPDDVLHAVAVEQLVGVDADGGHTHAGGHDGDLHAFVGAGVALNAPAVVDQHRIFQESFRDELGAQRIAGHEHGFAEVPGLGGNMRGGSGKHRWFSFH